MNSCVCHIMLLQYLCMWNSYTFRVTVCVCPGDNFCSVKAYALMKFIVVNEDTKNACVCVATKPLLCTFILAFFMSKLFHTKALPLTHKQTWGNAHSFSIAQQWQSQSNVKVMLKLFQFQQQRQTKEHTI